MTFQPGDELGRGLAAFKEGHLAETYRLLKPLADAGNVTDQACLGSFVLYSMHRFDTLEQEQAWQESASPEELAAFHREHGPGDREEAIRWLQTASDAGDGGASHNLAMSYVWGIGDEGWPERRRIILELLAKARSQGFGHFNDGDPPGVAYIEFLEEHQRRLDRQAAEGRAADSSGKTEP